MNAHRAVARHFWLLPLLAGVTAFLWFVPAVAFGFVYDDHWTILSNPWLRRPLSVLAKGMLNGSLVDRLPDATRPSMVVSMWLDWRLFGGLPLGYHLHSLLLYGLTCAIATCVLFAFLRNLRATLFGAAFFLVAAVHAEPVAVINYREDLLAAIGVFVPLAVLFRPRATDDRTPLAALAAVAWLVGLLGKESAAVLAVLVPALAVLLRCGRSWRLRHERTLYGLGAVLLLWLNWRLAMSIGGEPLPTAEYAGAFVRPLATAHYEVLALLHGLLPVFWSPEHLRPARHAWIWLLPLAVVGTSILWLGRRRSTRVCAVGLTIALLAPITTSPLVGPANFWGDRYAFVSVLGGALVWGWAAERVARRFSPRWRTWVLVASLLPLLVPAQHALRSFRDDLTFWSVGVKRAPDSPRAWHGLAYARRRSGDLDGSSEAIDRALAIRPSYGPALVSRVYLLLARGQVVQAREELIRLRQANMAGVPGAMQAEQCARLAAAEAKTCIEEGR